MLKRSLLLASLALAACGDNAPPTGNLPPVPGSPSLAVTMQEDDAIEIDVPATDPEGQPLIYSHSSPAHGTISGTGPVFVYAPAREYSGQDALEVIVSDGQRSVAIPVVITITPENDAPVASVLEVELREGEVAPLTLTGSDVDNPTLTFSVATMPAHGTLSGTPPNLTYTPDLNYAGGDTFTFTASDGALSSQPATVTLTIENLVSCGDGVVEGDEGCDDGNQDNSDACRNDCLSATCGDGVVQANVEDCDDGNAVDTDACRNNCRAAQCGDGAVYEGVEACDDGNQDDSDGCLPSCVAATCGDGFTRVGVEQCDDANQSNADSCLNVCLGASCGDGFVEDGVEDCDDGNQIDTDSCPNSCTMPVCGDGLVGSGEECDDGNVADNDGCGHTCLNERCGDGFVQLPAGETCDDGNIVNGDGCDDACRVEPFTTTGPVLISGGLSCTTSVANAARKIAVDGSGNLYAVMQCGTRAMAATSTNRGNSFSAPFDLSTSLGTPDSPAVVSQVAVGNGPTDVAYAAIMLSDGQVFLRVTEDAGLTWSPGVLVGQAVSTSSGLSLQSFNDNVYVGFSTSGGVSVARNVNRGTGPFELTSVGMSIAFFDLVYDVLLGTLAVVADTPGFHIRVSNDGGLTFAAEVNPSGQQFYSDWTIGNGFIFVSGTDLGASGNSSSVYRIASNNPSASTQISGLPAVSTAQSRTVAADAAGNLFAASQLNAGGIQLDRLGAGATTFDSPRLVSASGTSPIASGLPGNSGAAVVYTVGTEVYATIQVYP